MKVEKTKLCIMVSTNIYDRLQDDFLNFGVSKSHIVSTALMEYYQRRSQGSAPSVKGLSGTASDLRS